MNASGLIISPPEEENRHSFHSPLHIRATTSSLFRSLFNSRPLSPINPSPLCTAPDTPKVIPSIQIPESVEESFESDSPADDSTSEVIIRPSSLPITTIHSNIPNTSGVTVSVQESRTPSPSVELDSVIPIYEAESPDEVTLVEAAARYGIKLLKRSLNEILVSIPGLFWTSNLLKKSHIFLYFLFFLFFHMY